MRAKTTLLLLLSLLLSAVFGTPLDDYVQKPDPNFKYTLLSTQTAGDVTAYIYNMTSQQWLTTAEVKQPIQWHYVIAVVPKNYGPTVSYSIYSFPQHFL